MSTAGKLLAWVCAAVVALPLSPCAFFSSACCQHEAKASEQPVVAESSERPCCAQHAAPSNTPAEHPGQQDREPPCQGECCLLAPFTQSGEKVVLPSPLTLIAAVLPQFEALPAGEVLPLATIASRPSSLQILHCQWRL